MFFGWGSPVLFGAELAGAFFSVREWGIVLFKEFAD
jgi:hypothetical protein